VDEARLLGVQVLLWKSRRGTAVSSSSRPEHSTIERKTYPSDKRERERERVVL